MTAKPRPPRVQALTWAHDGALLVVTGRGQDTTCHVIRNGTGAGALQAVRDAAFVLSLPSGVLTLSRKGRALLVRGRTTADSATGFEVEAAVTFGGVAWAAGSECSLARFDETTGQWVRDEGLRAALPKGLDDDECSVQLLVEGPRGLVAAVTTGDDAYVLEQNGTKWVARGQAEALAMAVDGDGSIVVSGSDEVTRLGTAEVVAELEYASGLAWFEGLLFVACGRVVRIENGVPVVVMPPGVGDEPQQPFAVGKRLAYARGANVLVLSKRGEHIACWFGDDPDDVAALTARANQLAQKALKGRRPATFKLANKRLRRFPEVLLELEGLTALDLSMNDLEALPDDLGRLRDLETLELSDNHLTVLPDAIGRLTKLRSLNLHLNTLSSLPKSFSSLQHLEHLDLGMNTSLQTLDVRGARPLREVPPALRKLGRLKRLVLSMNELSSLPAWFAELTALEDLDLSSNRFEQFPEVCSRCRGCVGSRLGTSRGRAG